MSPPTRWPRRWTNEDNDRHTGHANRKTTPAWCLRRGVRGGHRLARARRFGAGVSIQTDPRHRPLCSGRWRRPSRAPGGPAALGSPQAAGGRGEPGRRQQHDRHAYGGRRAQGRLHAGARDTGVRDDAVAHQEPSLRHAEGLHPGRDDRLHAARARRASERAGENHEGVHRAREGESGHAQLRVPRRGHDAGAFGLDVQLHDRHRRGAGALQGKRARRDRPPRRKRPVHVQRAALDAAAGAGRQATRAWRHGIEALDATAGRSADQGCCSRL